MRLRRMYAVLFALIAMLLGVAVTETDARGLRAAEAAVSAQVERAAPVARGGTFIGPAPLDTLHPVHRAATYVATADPVRPSETASIPVTIRNLSEATWETNGAHPVGLSYHLYDAAGDLLSWDGPRSPLSEDVAPGGETTVLMSLIAPRYTGNFVVRPDLIRDGVAWFSHEEAPAGSFPLRVTTDLDAGYGDSTAPATIIPGGEVPVELVIANTGLATWHASGPHPIHVSYHWFDGSTPVIWDGARNALPHDLWPGEKMEIAVAVRAPSTPGTYTLAWDMVEEGVGWFSDHAVPMRATDVVTVSSDITLYGKGWGHGIGFSQWGAQGWAQGAVGRPLTGEQIVAHYFPLATLGTQPATKPFRVLLSYPSTGCVGRTIFSTAQMSSAGGMLLVNDADPSVVYLETAPNQPVRFGVYGGTTLVAVDAWSGRTVFAGDDDSLTLIPKQWWDPIFVREKGLDYRGNMLVQVRDEGMLRVVNYVGSDDYMKGALPGEMPSDWQMEALRAQAITARTYVAWRQSTAGDRTWDVRDDTADQCYVGHTLETPRATAAVASTKAMILTYDGKPIRALYSSADGGITENVGCVLEAERVGDTWKCADGWPYLAVIDDPAEALAYDRFGGMPFDLWATSFTPEQIRHEIWVDYGYDIGGFVAMRFNESPGGRPISVQIDGTLATVDLKGDRFLRTTLGLRSTLVRTTPF
ncbi:MAG: SpoIID/LytB domain-containing protein [Chloroflexi bacterium]|nr:MAG: SpoIID/LytB domain-containing protein [Chloroflexota bacterium]TMC29591.1 MAG: SpoIID/LytB domain-containing protein [Chloroflexota bacterium]TMC57652.1 MAG: SpoIID/LytB domain-containing protein [Chloroflexota bacterium]